jgi:hypothetical protein
MASTRGAAKSGNMANLKLVRASIGSLSEAFSDHHLEFQLLRPIRIIRRYFLSSFNQTASMADAAKYGNMPNLKLVRASFSGPFEAFADR